MTRPPTAPQFPPAVGSLYLSADHLVFQDPVLHNRRVIALSKVTDVRRVPVELQQARMILAHLPGFSLLARGGNLSNISLVNALARLAGFTSAKGRPALQAPTAGEVTPACAKRLRRRTRSRTRGRAASSRPAPLRPGRLRSLAACLRSARPTRTEASLPILQRA
jgi:hypothetical protein